MFESEPVIGEAPEGALLNPPVITGCNTSEDQLLDNVRINSQKDVEWLVLQPTHDKIAVMCGGGPSLGSTIEEIRARAVRGQVIFALNNAAAFLVKHGIVPDYQVIIDARQHNVVFVKDRPAKRYLIGSQVHPDLLDEIIDDDVLLFHFGQKGIIEVLQECTKGKTGAILGGNYVVGPVAICAAATLGFRTFHLYGYDSSDADDGRAHAYEQHEREGELERLEVWVDGRTFRCSYGMYKQAEQFPEFAAQMAAAGCNLIVHGDGLLPALARQMVGKADVSRVVYDLANCPASYDFIAWLTHAEMVRRQAKCDEPLRVHFKPGTREGFRDDKLPLSTQERQQFLDRVLRPALALHGAIEEPDREQMGNACWHPVYTFRPIVELAREGFEVPRLQPTWPALAYVDSWLDDMRITEAPVVITLREASHWPLRNSNVKEWARFADDLIEKGIPVVFVRDTEKANMTLFHYHTMGMAAVDLHVRVALYARARCNFFAMTGPTALGWVSDWPWISIQTLGIDPDWLPSRDDWWRVHHSIGEGEQFPWSRPDQRIVWGKDTYEVISAAWHEVEPLLRGG